MADRSSTIVSTPRLDTHVWIAGSSEQAPVLLLHGNVSSGEFFARVQAQLSERYFTLAADLRGFGRSQRKPVDATRGMQDFSDDIAQLWQADELGLRDRPAHVIGWSAGANVAMQLAMDHNACVASLTLINPGSPFGFGGTKGVDGQPIWPDFAGSGGGTANPEFVELLRSKHSGADKPTAPRNVMNTFYWKPPFKVDQSREDRYVAAMLDTATGPENYPGDATTSDNWPGLAPGTTGMNNALSPKYLNQAALAAIERKPPVLWIRGADDQIISDRSMFDFAVLGELGAVPGWPGAEQVPAQPMVAQTRHVLDGYRSHGGRYWEVVLSDCGHGPHIEKEAEFMATVDEFLARGEVANSDG